MVRGIHLSKISIGRTKEERFLREFMELAVLRDFMKDHREESIERFRRNIEKLKQALAQRV